MIDLGSGPPIVMVPGVQGRCEWMLPAIEKLAERHRVLSFSLGDQDSFNGWIRDIDRLLDTAREQAAALVGVSFGGLIATRYAAHRPSRVSALVLVSVPAPGWRLDRWSAICARHPLLASPLFFARGCLRIGPEILSARPSWPGRVRLAAEYGWRVARAPSSPRTMAGYVRAWQSTDLTGDCACVTAPTLIVTGEPHLDRVVPVESSREYLHLIRGARHVVLDRTGHAGLITTPGRFAETIDSFLDTAADSAQRTDDRTVPERTRHAS